MTKIRIQAYIDSEMDEEIEKIIEKTYLDSRSEVIRDFFRQKFKEYKSEKISGPAGVSSE